jgi:hypothetical protein
MRRRVHWAPSRNARLFSAAGIIALQLDCRQSCHPVIYLHVHWLPESQPHEHWTKRGDIQEEALVAMFAAIAQVVSPKRARL